MSTEPEVIETHISRVFLHDDEVFKTKKPVDFGFVDYSTREKRERYCHAEVALNGRWAPGVYLGVTEYEGEPAVHMRRLDDSRTMRHRVDSLTVDDARRVGAYLGELHTSAPIDPEARQYATAAAVADNALENFDQTREHIGWSVHPQVHARLERQTRAALERLGPLMDRRSESARSLHGDLRAEHAYLMPDGQIAFLDGVEFDARYRDGDPVNDVAFLIMDLAVRGRRDLADALADAWFGVTGDDEGRALLAFYVAYRSVVRAKIRGLQRDLFRARRHWLFALDQLVDDGPCILGVGGLPGTGKSTVAFAMAEAGDFTVIRSDVVRKELAGLDPLTPAGEEGYERGLYSEENKDRVYAECVRRAQDVVFAGGRAIVDASFSRERWRHELLDGAIRYGVAGGLVWCVAPPDVVKARLDARTGDPSDANWAVYQAAAPRWETEGKRTRASLVTVDASGSLDQTRGNAREVLARLC